THMREENSCVGLACLDIIQVVKEFPEEDSDTRCISMRWQRGGNASNNCTVLSQLGVPCEFFGTLSKQQHLDFMMNDFKAHNINIDNCVYYDNCDTPISVVISSLTTGSRTIIHSNKNLPELTLEDFKKLDLSQYGWIHFEGRNVEEVTPMIEWVEMWNESHSSEQDRGYAAQDLIPMADVLFVSKDFAEFRGCTTMSETLRNLALDTKHNATIISAWGERGAMARAHDGTFVQSPAFPPNKVVDTLGAGDTFCATTLYGLSRGFSLQDCIFLGCQVAGAKVRHHSFGFLN
ncbi:hypothetical protein L9F63_024817, partial [Diploptera punctata]